MTIKYIFYLKKQKVALGCVTQRETPKLRVKQA